MHNTDYIAPFLYEISNFIGKRWNFRVLWELRAHKKMRYNELLESLSGISPSTLAETLRYLEKESLIKRSVFGNNPPFKVEYNVTEKGLALIVASSSLVKWAIRKAI
ncbi:MAG: helix-turn-helix domain-containing protein [Candidatus Nitrosotenuis sp.]|nr:helix-turn-helix domain-containing protein [Candidatus Nitrosotenuis uzonensis]MCA2003926.1 helix-turn-helix transcriptional regulator [Candidatus Nitrosotenuis sp.]